MQEGTVQMQLNWDADNGKDVPAIRDKAIDSDTDYTNIQRPAGYEEGIDNRITYLDRQTNHRAINFIGKQRGSMRVCIPDDEDKSREQLRPDY